MSTASAARAKPTWRSITRTSLTKVKSGVCFGSRKLRLAPQGYSPWTSLADRLHFCALYPLRGMWTLRGPSRRERGTRGERTELQEVLERGPGRVALGSKPQLATSKENSPNYYEQA